MASISTILTTNPPRASRTKTFTVPRRAYVTCLAGNGHNWNEVVELAKDLRKAKSEYPLVVAVLPGVSRELRGILVNQSCRVEEIKPVFLRNEGGGGEVCSVLRIFELEKYTKMIYLKPGVQVIGNTDGLFELPDGGQFYAVENCLCENGNLSNCPLSNPGIKAHFPPCRFNTDMFVFEPSVSTFNALLHKLAAKKAILGSGPGNIDQLLNSHFGDSYQPLDPIYNFHVHLLRHHPDKLPHVKVLGSGLSMLLKKSLDDDYTTNSSADQKKNKKRSVLEKLLACFPCCAAAYNCVDQQTGGIDCCSAAETCLDACTCCF